jgi:CBS domain-containing membrane protein
MQRSFPRLPRWFARLLPQPNTASRAEQWRGMFGALAGLTFAGFCLQLTAGDTDTLLIAPMGASAILLFCLPASPLAQPWPVIFGNVLSALVGVLVARVIDVPLLAAPLAAALAIFVMFRLRCLHPPGGSIALMAALGNPAVVGQGLRFPFVTVAVNATLMVVGGLFFNYLLGRRYPHFVQSPQRNAHATADAAPTARLGFTDEDLDGALARYGQVLDVSRDDLEAIILDIEQHAHARRFGSVTCGAAMSRDIVALNEAAPVGEAWRLMRRHRIHALPVIEQGRLVGVLSQGDLLTHAGAAAYGSSLARLRALFAFGRGRTRVGALMRREVRSVREDTPVVELVPLMANSGLHHFPVLGQDGRCVGMITQSDLIAALYERGLAG